MVEELLRSIELPVLATYLLEQRKVEAQVALRSITGMLVASSNSAFPVANRCLGYANDFHACRFPRKRRIYTSITIHL